MSLVFLTHHNEYIQNITNKYEDIVVHRLPTYKSQQHKKTNAKKVENIQYSDEPSKVIVPSKQHYASHKTMGYAETPWPDPCNFLRKNNGIKFSRMPQHKCYKKEPSPPIPRVSDMPKKTELKQTKNFKQINVKNVENAVVKRPLPKVATTITGDTKLLCNAGILPAYIFSPNYGKVPNYLKKTKECSELCKQFAPKESSKKTPLFNLPEGKYNQKQIQQFTKQMLKVQKLQWENQKKKTNRTYTRPAPQLPPHITLIPDEVRKEIIAGLKKNFIEIMENYQKGPVYVDTIPKKLRRSKIENELRQIEEDVILLEFNPVIYVCNSESKPDE